MDKKIRKRNPNWDDLEKTLLRQCIENYLSILENKCTDTNTNKQKTITWQKVAQSFNELNSRNRQLIEIKQQWRTMKIEAKKCNSEYKRALKATGGGPKPPSPDPTVQKLVEMLPHEFEEDQNFFDSDTITLTVEEQKREVFIIQDDHEMAEQNDTISQEVVTQEIDGNKEKIPRTSPILSKLPRNKKRCKIKEDFAKERNEIVINCLKRESDLKLTQMAETHEWAREKHKLEMKQLELQNTLITMKIAQLNNIK